MKPILGDLPQLGRLMVKDLACAPLIFVVSLAVANGVWKVTRDAALMPDAHLSVADRSSMWGTRN
jgi:hypothetical protein